MTKIELLPESQASESTQELYGAIKSQMGKVPNVYQVYGHSSAALKANLQLGETLSGGELSKKEIEIVSLVVSQGNGCEYCLAAHSMLGGMNGMSDDEMIGVRKGIHINEKEQALISFAKAVYENKGRISQEVLSNFLATGYTNGAAVEVIGQIALNTFNNYTNNLAGTPVDFPEPKAF
ncbi:carboxymuconolactone decarboxylase family protein [Flagellimonas lutimaris]|nr:carboxymuconolactone decarboxylase family protein [Allomuricauda lutimaris]